ncbi:lysine-sensitive aspartokinase 3 [candidate division KSB1 bacterium]|nr:lysine-sensitive aspartokinase 3 [candidate division KSB1 bacterium]RQW01801.1 MAG: lysine-sensitive aspartokinase 3 [candidate division KSB1 bacterium]
MIILKFGGTSVGSAAAIRRVCEIIKSRLPKQPLVVTSAIGGITNKLVSLAKIAGAGEEEKSKRLTLEILTKHRAIIRELGIDADTQLIAAFETGVQMLNMAVDNIYNNGRLTDELYDAVISVGEFFTAHMLPAALRRMGLSSEMTDSRKLLLTDSSFSAAQPLFEASKKRTQDILAPIVSAGIVPVIQGFIGSDQDGRTTTLGRGGSDYSATLFGAMLGAPIVEIWSDVDGVLTADPSLVKEAHRIRHMTFKEAAELAYFGAKVLHPATLAPAIEHNMTVIVLNSMNPEFPGTAISKTSPVDPSLAGRVKSIAYKEGLTVITVMSSRMLMAHGFMARLFAIFEKYKTAVDLISTSEVTVSLTIDNATNLEQIISEVAEIASVKVEKAKAIVCLVGEGLKRTKGIPGQIFGLLQDTHIYSISQGASEINLSFVIDEADLPKVIIRLHDYFFGSDLDSRIFAV